MESLSQAFPIDHSETTVSKDQSPVAINIENLTKRYGGMTAVNTLSLAINKGTLFGFLGPNGAGKSTTIGCLTGLIDPTAGRINLLGQPFDSNSI